MIKRQEIGNWTDTLASGAPVPGGGGASALGGSLAAALGQMVANLTVGKKKYAEVEEEMQAHLLTLRGFQEDLMRLADRDAEVFAPLAESYRLPSGTEEEKTKKAQVMEKNLLAASLVPLEMMEKSVQILRILDELERKGSRMAVSDVGVAAQLARAALAGAVMNVFINTKSMKDREKAEELNARSKALTDEGLPLADAVYSRVLAKLL
ncbi:MAG: cyclodeaminase/cyclohydrolase family protein [Clostridiales bacterium]|nr:cyclodeaminase/cyclohydrolase family protein [Clostridiales bacterium]